MSFLGVGFLGGKLDVRDVERGLRKAHKAGRDLRPFFKVQRKALRADQREHAKDQESPEGRWPARAAATMATIQRKRRAGRKARQAGMLTSGKRRSIPRRILGRLPAALAGRIVRSGISFTSRSRIGIFHQEGEGVPRRTFLWWSEPILRSTVTALEQFVVDAYGAK